MSEKEYSEFRGMFVTLKKRIKFPVEKGDDSYKFFVWGHYDGMNIMPISKWGYFSPSQYLEDSNPNASEDDELKNLKRYHSIEIDDCVLEQYAIKACFPSSDKISDLTKKGFRYDIWGSDLLDSERRELDQQYPFVACALLQLTEEFIESCNDTEQIIINIADVIKNYNNGDISDLNCSIYFSVGYSDAVILFRVKEFECVSDVLDGLRIEKVNGATNKPIVSDLYTVTGFARESFKDLDEVKNLISKTNTDNLCNISVSFALKPGVSIEKFRSSLIDYIKIYFSGLGYNFDEKTNVVLNADSFGNTDAVVAFKLPINLFPTLYMEYNDYKTGPFHLKSDIFKKYIVSQKVSVFTDENSGRKNLCAVYPEISLPEEHKEFLKELKNFLTENEIYMRVYVAIRQMLITYHNLVSSNHSFDIKKLIGKAFDMFIENMYFCMGKIENQNFSHGMYDKFVTAMLKAVNDFRCYIEPFLNDLSRSDRNSIEGRGLTHPSIGTSTKLLFAYNQYINNIADSLNNSESDGEKKFSFVVVSGGCDKTEINEIFRFIGPWNKNYAHLFIITIPEKSIFDIKGMLFRLLHECFHCFGDRKRKVRFEKTIRAVISYTAYEFSEVLFDEEYNLIGRFKGLEDILVLHGKKEEVLNKVRDIKKSFRDKFLNELTSCVKESVSFKKIMDEDENSEVFYTSEAYKSIGRILEENFVFGAGSYSEFYLAMQKYYFNCQSEILKYIVEATYDAVGEQIVIFQEELLAELEYYKCSDLEPRYINNDYLDYFNKVCMGFVNPDCLRQIERYEYLYKSDPKRKEIEKYKISGFLPYTFRELAQIFIESMCERFTDGHAIEILGIDAADFLLNFVYEAWDVTRAIPDDFVNIFRIGATLKGLKFTSELTNEQKAHIESRLDEYKNSGLKIEVNKEAFYKQINRIIYIYNQFAHCTQYVEEYWEACIKGSKTIASFDIKDLYGNCVKNEKVYEFIGLWKDLAGDGTQNA